MVVILLAPSFGGREARGLLLQFSVSAERQSRRASARRFSRRFSRHWLTQNFAVLISCAPPLSLPLPWFSVRATKPTGA